MRTRNKGVLRPPGASGENPRSDIMSGSAFAVFLLIGASVLALWLDAHRPGLAPASGRRIALRLVSALVLLPLAPKANGSPIASFARVFGLILPAPVLLFPP